MIDLIVYLIMLPITIALYVLGYIYELLKIPLYMIQAIFSKERRLYFIYKGQGYNHKEATMFAHLEIQKDNR